MSEYTGFFWTEQVWLPPNTTWSDLVNDPGKGEQVNYRRVSDLWFPIPAAIAIIMLRAWLEKNVFKPFGIYLGLSSKSPRPPATNPALEDVYRNLIDVKSKIPDDVIQKLAKKLEMSDRQVERWLRRRRAIDRPTILDKFAETGWRFVYYASVFVYGMWVLWSKPWLWDIKYCWYNYPHHGMERDVWWYYMIELSFYWSLCISQFFDVKRKDFWQMFIHHVTTIALMAFSWTCNLTRIGTLVLAVHDCADIFLEAGKMCKYTNFQKTCDFLFVCFTLTWILTRLGVYPTHILYSTTIEAPQLVQMFPAYYIFNVLLSTLLILHVIWTYYILKIVYQVVMSGAVEGDVRSDSSDADNAINDSSDNEKDKND